MISQEIRELIIRNADVEKGPLNTPKSMTILSSVQSGWRDNLRMFPRPDDWRYFLSYVTGASSSPSAERRHCCDGQSLYSQGFWSTGSD